MGRHSDKGQHDTADGRVGNTKPDRRGRDADPDKNTRDRGDIGQPEAGRGRHRRED
jgi:hypothetical protein